MIDVQCLVCKNTENNSIFSAREMMMGTRATFDYLECGNCGCLYLIEPPEDLDNYYPRDYYSYKNTPSTLKPPKNIPQLKRFFKSILMDAYLDENNLLGKMVTPKLKNYYPWIKKNTFTTHSKILDIGCGTGELLQTMYLDGFRHLTGLDPFIEDDIHYESGINIHKKKPEEINECFDVIMMHHAFEHMNNPLEILNKMHELLAKDGYLIIRIPVADSYAWNKYRENWVQLDAPRHAFLHTKKSMELLSEQSHFKIIDITFDSYEFQFTGSEKYAKGIALHENSEEYTHNEIEQFRTASEKLNTANQGDQACYYLQKTGS